MTPKEKAKELFDDFLELMDIQYAPNARDMAVRCTEEQIELTKGTVYSSKGSKWEEKYWQEVKEELEKL